MFRSSLRCLYFSVFCFVSWNCTKIDSTVIGASLLPVVDNVNTFDTTITVVANNFDSVAADCFTFYPEDLHLLGCIKNNPLFGTTEGTIYTELKPASYPFSFPANSSIDSVVLVLSYKSSFGDTTIPQKVNVYKISGTFTPDSSSCRSYNHEAATLGSAVYSPLQLDDSVFGFREASSKQLRIRLEDDLGQALLSHNPAAAFPSDSAFKEFLKGFAIVPDVSFGGNALSYFSLADTNTKLAVYYKTTGASPDTAVTNFRLTYLSRSGNNVVRNHTGAEIANHQTKPSLGDNEIYIQTTPGTSAEINISDLGKISNRIINRAVLTMEEIYDPNSLVNIFPTPGVLFLDRRNDTALTKSFKPLPCDFNTLSGSPDITTFGGFKTIVKDPFGHDISRYTFNISRYAQKIVTNKITTSVLRLRAPDNIINLTGYVDECGQSVIPFIYPLNQPAYGQVRLGGGNSVNYRMKLYIVYSSI